MTRLYMVIDVESDGLFGPGFAVGYVVTDERGSDWLDQGLLLANWRCRTKWVQENVLPALKGVETTHQWMTRMRTDFWDVWTTWRQRGAIMAADVPFPVEARFLTECVHDQEFYRTEQSPYPLLDIDSLRRGVGIVIPDLPEPRLESELPIHNPLADARQSARLLVEALQRQRAGRAALDVATGEQPW